MGTRKAFILAATAAALSAGASDFMLATPPPPQFDVGATSPWAAANALVPSLSGLAPSANGIVSTPRTGADIYRQIDLQAGYAVDRDLPQYWLGDTIAAPENVDWDKTHDLFTKDPSLEEHFLFDLGGERVIAINGGSRKFTWVLDNGGTKTETFLVSNSSATRPFKIFWTDEPYMCPPVDLKGVYAKVVGNKEIVKREYGIVTNYVSGTRQEIEQVVCGVYIDRTSSMLYAVGGVEGQFVLAYYDSGDMNHLLHTEVVEAANPVTIQMKGEIGKALQPYGSGYNPDGLRGFPTTSSADENNRGPFFYQHSGKHSYSPKAGNIYPLRPTMDNPARIEVIWKEADVMGTLWPFERCQYSCDWPEDMQIFVRGDGDLGLPILWDNNYNVELMEYQDPPDHAVAPDGAKSFTTKGPGRSLLRIVAEDDVWFLPIRSIRHDDTEYFTLEREPWLVGSEILARGGALSGTTPKYNCKIDRAVPGYIYESASADNFNNSLYHPATDDAAKTNTTQRPPSAIFPVSTSGDGKAIEVWWSSSFQPEGMGSPLTIPSLVQLYDAKWPEDDEAPRIVIASQKGSALQSVYKDGIALAFMSGQSTLTLPDRSYFSDYGGVVSFRTFASTSHTDTASAILEFGSESAFGVKFTANDAGDIVALIKSPDAAQAQDVELAARGAAKADKWVSIDLVLAEEKVELYADGELVDSRAIDKSFLPGFYDSVLCGNQAGANGDGLAAAVGRCIDAIVVFNAPQGADEVKAREFQRYNGAEENLTACFTMVEGTDLNPISGANFRYATDKKSGYLAKATDVVASQPGSPKNTACVIDSDTTPTVYYVNKSGETGYNPNNEHAFITQGAGGHVVWALRSDLPVAGQKNSVLVQYEKNGQSRMQYFNVMTTDEEYPELADSCEAGNTLPGPHPFDLLENPWLKADWWTGDAETTPAFKDRKGQIWARCAGRLDVRMYYAMQEGFWFPSIQDGMQPAVGTPVPWLSQLDKDNASVPVNEAPPAKWTWNVTWPRTVRKMRIGQTLTTASDNLPEVWGALSEAVVYPGAERDDVAMLFDPTAIQSKGFDGYKTYEELLSDFGFSTGGNGNVTAKGGKYYFTELPPTLSSRVFIDTTRDITNCLCVAGEMEAAAGSVAMLHVNVLSSDERAALAALSPNAKWKAAVRDIAKAPIKPNSYSYTTGGSNGKDSNQLTVSYDKAVDHYAIAAMGGTNYVTIIENDNPDKKIVPEANPISMHVFQVVDEYYTAPVVTREDRVNLLSQQLDVLYTESFAGHPDDYEFKWQYRLPSQDSFSDYNDYRTWGQGRTRFTIGKQGDTLDNMVNKYFGLCYRAKEGTRARKIMGDAWSDFCGPALAEGWVQRVLNNVTPFTQKLADLYSNPAETVVSMLRQAGGPFEGDIALNSDNLDDVGLIQLYQTILDKAESMSVLQGIDNAEANKQLLLASERLADLYQILGDEALADAMNPTIGFGSEFSVLSDTSLGIDYGSASSGLFAFDNQVRTLLDEEIALLRGRDERSISPAYNRLLWNFTRGMNAGEVAYAVNYDIVGNDGTIDVADAAELYPQGHGDAYGHYLSAITPFYRLLRNPYFTWGEPGAGEMNIGDAPIAVDYEDEQRFTQIGAAMARTAREVVSRTAAKSWGENASMSGAGYTDVDKQRGFGYGDWATKGGIGALANWALANSLLPEENSGDYYRQLVFERTPMHAVVTNRENSVVSYEMVVSTTLSADMPQSISLNPADPWTIEFQLDRDSDEETSEIFSWEVGNKVLYIGLVDGVLTALGATNAVDAAIGDDTGVVERIPVWKKDDIGFIPARKGYLVAFVHDPMSVQVKVYVLDENNSVVTSQSFDPNNYSISGGTMTIGYNFSGLIREFRIWGAARTIDQLVDKRFGVSKTSEGLAMSLRTMARAEGAATIFDEAAGIPWRVENGAWRDIAQSGMRIDFDDAGLDLVNRKTVTAINELASELSEMQSTVAQIDSGMNPLGLSDSAIPFDITPIGVDDGTHTHFEQIYERAEQALQNAGKVLDRAQTYSSRLRQIQEAENSATHQNEAYEASIEAQLAEIFGYPYSGDIGPGKTYPQGYDGPDIYHFMWMDLSDYGIDKIAPSNCVTVTYKLDGIKDKKLDTTTTNSLTLSANGLVVKPADVTGKRKSVGKIQQAYADFVVKYTDMLGAADTYKRKIGNLDYVLDKADVIYGTKMTSLTAHEALDVMKIVEYGIQLAGKLADQALSVNYQVSQQLIDEAEDAVPQVTGVGLTVVTDVGRIAADLAIDSSTTPLLLAALYSRQLAGATGARSEASVNISSALVDMYENAVAMKTAEYEASDSVKSAISDAFNAAIDLQGKYSLVVQAADAFDVIITEGEGLMAGRARTRREMASTATRMRYNDMFFRQMRNKSLTRYSQSLDIAKKYAFLAAQAYDYETSQLPSDDETARDFRNAIVSARTVGELDKDGRPMVNGGYGDPGLSDILARMKANWDALKPRLGINNPQKDATWFSLRRECFRINGDSSGDLAWKTELSKYWAPDLNASPEFRRYCMPFAATGNGSSPEPGLVIPFSTTIDFAKNFFGHDLAGGDSAYDSTYFATKVAGASIRFEGYNKRLNGYNGEGRFSATPSVYLVPVGSDVMRVPGGENGTTRSFDVIDQVVPAPYKIGSDDLDKEDWQPLYDGYTGGVDLAARIRRYPSFRAGTDAAEPMESTRLVGRSAWNTRWLLVIPAGTLSGSMDRDEALSMFINGKDLNGDGNAELSGVTDIKLGIRSYSMSGN